MNHAEVSEELARRIRVLIEDQPQILTMTSAWDLFKVPGFRCADLQPTLAQADGALAKAKAIWHHEHSGATT